MESGDYTKNGLRVVIDWLAFTVPEPDMTLQELAELLGFGLQDFTQLEHGGMGYKSALRLKGYPITIYYDGNENMGKHVVIAGSAISEAMNAYKESLLTPGPFGPYYDKPFDASFLSQWLTAISSIGKITRLDLAIDDLGETYFSMDSLSEIFENHAFVSKARKWNEQISHVSDADNTKIGHTIYLGKRESAVFLRIYDKALEQGSTSIPWTRWELELKEDRAVKAAELLIAKDNLGSVCIGILSNCLRLILPDSNNRSRCSVNPTWEMFLDGVQSLKLYVAPPAKSIEEKEAWLRKQAAPSLALVVLAHGGEINFLENLVYDGCTRLNKSHIDTLNRYDPSCRSFLPTA